MKQEENKAFWNDRSKQCTGHDVSWWDINMKNIEVASLSKLICPNDHVLDVGCSNGASTLEIHNNTGASFLGIDYSELSIKEALAIENPKINFRCMNILDYDESERFDKVISIRYLINIMDKSNQYRAVENIHSALKRGGAYLMCEAFSGAFHNLNRARALFGLNPLQMPRQNVYFDEKEFEASIRGMFIIKNIIRHSSLYYIGTRLFQYLCLDSEPKEHDTELHRFFGKYGYETKNSGDFGPNKLYVLEKK
jgi:SAM-dependent methyltransferase